VARRREKGQEEMVRKRKVYCTMGRGYLRLSLIVLSRSMIIIYRKGIYISLIPGIGRQKQEAIYNPVTLLYSIKSAPTAISAMMREAQTSK
jgi:hypothetical protein